MRFFQKSKDGFSLVELMIVLAIVSLLAVLAVGAYSGARQSARLDTAADVLISAFKDAQLQSKTGRRTGETARSGGSGADAGVLLPHNQRSECHGLRLTVGAGAEYLTAPYYAVKENEADFCDLTDTQPRSLDAVERFEIFSVESLGRGVSDELVIFMKPPSGNIVVGNMAMVTPVRSSSNPTVVVEIGLPGLDDTRTVEFHLVSGVAQRVSNEQ